MISVVIPTLNEAQNLPGSIGALRANTVQCEVWVVDCGSTDGTPRTAMGLGAELIQSSVRQRAAQMNLGARAARGEVLWFLHADTIVPKNALEQITEALKDERVLGGAFARRFDSPSNFLRLTCWLANVRNRVIGWHLGDQGMFVRKEIFEALGGFREMDRFEDLDFSRRLRARGRLVTLQPSVVSSARRFCKEGALIRTCKDFWLTMGYVTDGREEIRQNSGSRTATRKTAGA